MAVHDKSIDRCSSRKLQSDNNIAVGTNFLETNKADTEMRLFKSPQPLSGALSNSPGYPSRPVAKVTISVDPLQSNNVDDDDNSSATEFTMELTGSDSEYAFSAYSLNTSTYFYPMSVFSDSTQGKILKNFDMKPQNLARYGKLYRERNCKRETERRKTKVIDHVPEEHMSPMPRMDILNLVQEKKKATRRRSRRVRKDSGELESIIFRLFETQPYWTFKQLIQHTEQPEQYMREILKRLCVSCKKGVEKRKCYELKPEFQGGNEFGVI